MLISIIVPCYNEQEALPIFYREASAVLSQMDCDYELLLINDGSKDRTLAIMKELAASDPHVFYFSFSRNFGKEAAMYAGFCNARGDYIAVMDADLQDPPSLLPEMVKVVEQVMSEQKGLSKIVSNKGIKSGYDVEVVNDDKTKVFVARIANAEMVITDSFHASAFALLFGVPVYGFSGSKGDDRLLSLYRMLGVEERFVGMGVKNEANISAWDEEQVEKYIAQLRAESIAYLKEAIG